MQTPAVEPERGERKKFDFPTPEEIITAIKELDEVYHRISLNLIKCSFDAKEPDVVAAFPEFTFFKVKNYNPGSFEVVFENRLDAINFVRSAKDKRILGRRFWMKMGIQKKEHLEDWNFVGYVPKDFKGMDGDRGRGQKRDGQGYGHKKYQEKRHNYNRNQSPQEHHEDNDATHDKDIVQGRRQQSPQNAQTASPKQELSKANDRPVEEGPSKAGIIVSAMMSSADQKERHDRIKEQKRAEWQEREHQRGPKPEGEQKNYRQRGQDEARQSPTGEMKNLTITEKTQADVPKFKAVPAPVKPQTATEVSVTVAKPQAEVTDYNNKKKTYVEPVKETKPIAQVKEKKQEVVTPPQPPKVLTEEQKLEAQGWVVVKNKKKR